MLNKILLGKSSTKIPSGTKYTYSGILIPENHNNAYYDNKSYYDKNRGSLTPNNFILPSVGTITVTNIFMWEAYYESGVDSGWWAGGRFNVGLSGISYDVYKNLFLEINAYIDGRKNNLWISTHYGNYIEFSSHEDYPYNIIFADSKCTFKLEFVYK